MMVNNKDIWDAYEKELNGELQEVYRCVERAEEKDVYRYQGEIRRIRRMLQLRERVNSV